jgi:TPR repeat protein/uncharacterized RDD family membrane protein YckC
MNPNWQTLCPGCFEDKGQVADCPHCGYDEAAERGPVVLPHRALLQGGQYLIGRVLGKPGGFGITYLAFDTGLDTRVAIKEYLPRDLAGRGSGHSTTVKVHAREDGELFRYGLDRFLDEARTLARFDHMHLVRVRHVFEENDTAYLVMDYYEGMTLAEYLGQKGRLPERTALDVLMPILDGLREVHGQDILHRDIKPQNIYLAKQGRPILLDFGAARVAMGERSKSLSTVLTPGYAPLEQYHSRGGQGPWTDVYACAAVLYEMVTGEAPPDAPSRSEEDTLAPPRSKAPGLSSRAAQAIARGLAIKPKDRTQSIQAFQQQLRNDSSPTPPSQPHLFPGFWKRCAAMAVDGFVVGFLDLILLGFMGMAVGLLSGEPSKQAAQAMAALFLLATVLLPWAYYAWMESSAHQATIGKMALGIKVVDAQGSRISFWRASGRYLGKLVSAWALLGGFLMAAFAPRKQALHDRMAKCWVVSRAATPEQVRQEVAADPGMPRPLLVGLAALLVGVSVAVGVAAFKDRAVEEPDADEGDGLVERAQNGDAEAQRILGDFYAAGREIARDNGEAMRWYRKAAEQGDAAAQVMLGWMYDKGLGTEVNYGEALRWYRKAASQGDLVAQERLSILYRLGRGVVSDAGEGERWAKKTAGHREQVAEWYRRLADWGDPTAQNNLGNMYTNGDGVRKDIEKGIRWLRLAAEQGLKEAQGNLGRMYYEGGGVAKDYAEALGWYGRAAEQGDPTAQTRIGWMYRLGQGTARDEKVAFRWFRAAAEQGDAWGQTSLGNAYADGSGVAKDEEEAVKWLLKAAEQGHAGGQYGLGVMYQYGRGVANDDKQAVKWYRKAAEQGLGDAQINLGWMYGSGRGVPKNDAEAVKWYRKAADQDSAMAQFNLGVMYQNGSGVPKDLEQAVKWYRKAAAQGYDNAKQALKKLGQ